MFHDMQEFVSSPPPKSRLDADYYKPCQLNNWYGIWMRVKGPHNCMVVTFELYVKWPSRY